MADQRESSQNVEGTVSVAVGTITAGTINAGTVQLNKTPLQVGTPYGTLATASGAGWGTLVAASGAGTKQYIQGAYVVVVSGTVDCAITFGVAGSQGTGVILRGQFVPSAGINSVVFDPILSTGTNGTIAYWMGGAGTANFGVTYWQGV